MAESRVSLGTVILSLVAAVVVAALVYVFWPNEERIIRARLMDIASILTVPANEADLPRMERVAHLRDYLAPDIHVRYGSQEAATRDMVLGALVQWGRIPDGVKVEFVDVQVTLDQSRANAASAYLTAKITGRDSVDARIVSEVLLRSGAIIDSQQQVGGWPELKSTVTPKDSDGDGMPDEWERRYGLNPLDPSDAERACRAQPEALARRRRRT